MGIPGLDLACRYVPAQTAAEVGGDWFDVIPRPLKWFRLTIAPPGTAWPASWAQLRYPGAGQGCACSQQHPIPGGFICARATRSVRVAAIQSQKGKSNERYL